MLLVEGIPRQSVDRWNVGIKYSPLKRVLPVRYSRTRGGGEIMKNRCQQVKETYMVHNIAYWSYWFHCLE